jgi:mono/diheme cytochrome c family protein
MSPRLQRLLLLGALLVSAAPAAAQSAARAGYDVEFIGTPLADPMLQHDKETYVLFGCAYCHGVNLVARGEATDLMRSRLVGRDVNADLIGPLLRAGIPQTAKLSPMPQFSDLSDQQIGAIARWIHYARRQGRSKELSEARGVAGSAAQGQEYFAQACSSCHATATDLGSVDRNDRAALRAEILSPKVLDGEPSFAVGQLHDARKAAGRQRHHTLLENYTAENVADLVAYLQSVK